MPQLSFQTLYRQSTFQQIKYIKKFIAQGNVLTVLEQQNLLEYALEHERMRLLIF